MDNLPEWIPVRLLHVGNQGCALRFYSFDIWNLRKVCIKGNDGSDLSSLAHSKMNCVTRREFWEACKESPSNAKVQKLNRMNDNPKAQNGIKEPKSCFRLLDCSIAMEDLLQHLGIRTMFLDRRTEHYHLKKLQ